MKIVIFWVLFFGGLMIIRSPQDSTRKNTLLMGQWPYNILLLSGTAVLSFSSGAPSWLLWLISIGGPIGFHLYRWLEMR